MWRELPKRSGKAGSVEWFYIEPCVVFDSMSDVNPECSRKVPTPSDSSNFTPLNLSLLPEPAYKKTPGSQLPIDKAIIGDRRKQPDKKQSGVNKVQEMHGRLGTKKLQPKDDTPRSEHEYSRRAHYGFRPESQGEPRITQCREQFGIKSRQFEGERMTANSRAIARPMVRIPGNIDPQSLRNLQLAECLSAK